MMAAIRRVIIAASLTVGTGCWLTRSLDLPVAASAGAPASCAGDAGIDDPGPRPPYSCLATFYVSPGGSDANDGATPERSKQTIGAMLRGAGLAAGSCVVVGDGTYDETVEIDVSGSSASPAGYFVLKSSAPRGAKLVGPKGSYSTVTIRASYVVVDGFDLVASDGHGIDVDKSHHVVAINNTIHDSGGSGISCVGGDYYWFEGNTCYSSCKTNEFGPSGIAISRATAYDSAPGYHNVIRGNVTYDNVQSPSVKPDLHIGGQGIAILDFHGSKPSYTARTLIEDNLSYRNGGPGISVRDSDGVVVRNNTTYRNNQDNVNPATFRGELAMESYDGAVSGVVWANNIAVADPAANPNNVAILDASVAASSVTWQSNLSFDGASGSPSLNITNGSRSSISAANGNMLGVDPSFVAPGTDFHLKPSSPAIGSGSAAQASRYDLDGHLRCSPITLGCYSP
jgi:serralysin